MKLLGFLTVGMLAILTLGCGSGEEDLSEDQETQLQNNMTREMTAEEMQALGGGAAADAPAREASGN